MRFRIFIALVLVFVITVVVGIKPALMAWIRKEIQRQIPGSKVTIEHCEFGFYQANFRNVVVNKPDVFDFQAKDIQLRYTMASLFKQNISDIMISDVAITYQKLKVNRIQVWGWVKSQEYSFHAALSKMPITDVINAFKLNKKLDWQGSLDGELNLSGDAKGIKTLNGNFTAGKQGGVLVIKDTGFLENMARSSKLPVNIVVDSFKNYHYDNGDVRVSLTDGNVFVLDAALKGQAGKRNLKINLHNFNLR